VGRRARVRVRLGLQGRWCRGLAVGRSVLVVALVQVGRGPVLLGRWCQGLAVARRLWLLVFPAALAGPAGFGPGSR